MIDWNKRNGGFLSPKSVYEDQLNNLSVQMNAKDKEIERLNNIINELEKILKECMQHYDYLYDEFEEKEALDTYYDYKYVFDKLQELKGDSSNE